ncbi:MAG: 3-keto-5-aminohexanoate cleavage protein, partial [Ideonella sp.]|nr:3-keto-5-aminohexanoate cleavage protein [Ideonella sp.]
NFSIHPVARRYTQWRHAWEQPYVEGMEDLIFRNTFRDIRRVLQALGRERGTRFEFECYDVGHLYNLAHVVDEGLVEGPLFIQCIFGILGGLGPDPENLVTMRATADRLFGRGGYRFSVLGAGRHQMPLLTMGAVLGSHVRVGLEDSLTLGRGQLATSCAEQVLKIRRILGELSLDVATPAEARLMLGLKGRHAVSF